MNFLENEEEDEILNAIVRRRDIARRTNWRWWSTALSQRDIVVASSLRSSISFYITILYMILFQLNSINQIILRNNNPGSAFFGRLLRALKYNKCLMMLCVYEVDLLIQDETNLLFLRRNELFPLINAPPRNRSIDDILEEMAKQLTRFTKDQLRLLLLHWRIPNVIVTGPHYQFSGEEILLVSMAKIATGDPWTRLIDRFFCGDPRHWTYAFRWFVNHPFTVFYHKISGRLTVINN
jgi:hypothetical protein